MVRHLSLGAKTWRFLKAPEVRLWKKLVGLLAVAYVVIPFDAIPDFIPVLGWLDDVGVLGVAVWFLIREIRRYEPPPLDSTPAPPAQG